MLFYIKLQKMHQATICKDKKLISEFEKILFIYSFFCWGGGRQQIPQINTYCYIKPVSFQSNLILSWQILKYLTLWARKSHSSSCVVHFTKRGVENYNKKNRVRAYLVYCICCKIKLLDYPGESLQGSGRFSSQQMHEDEGESEKTGGCWSRHNITFQPPPPFSPAIPALLLVTAKRFFGPISKDTALHPVCVAATRTEHSQPSRLCSVTAAMVYRDEVVRLTSRFRVKDE